MLLRLKLNEAVSRSFIWCIFKRWSFLKSGRDGAVYDEKDIILNIFFCREEEEYFLLEEE